MFRQYKNYKYVYDVIGLDGENLGESLLKQIFKKGKLVYNLPKFSSIRNYTRHELNQLPDRYKVINKELIYPIKHSRRLQSLIQKVKTAAH